MEENSQLASHTAGQGLTSSPLVCSPLRRAFTGDGRNTKRAGIDFLLGGGGSEGRLLEGGGVDCPHQTPLLFSQPSPFLLLFFSSAWLWRDPLFVSQAVERLPLTPPPFGFLSFLLSFSVSLSFSISKPPPPSSASLVFLQSPFLAFLRSVKWPVHSSFKGEPINKVNKVQRQSEIP